MVQQLISGTLKPRPDQFPRFLYKDLTHDPEDMFEGFLKSSLLTKAFKSVYKGPSAWQGKGVSKNKCRCKASLCNLQQVTGCSIAYIAVLVHMSLSSAETLQRKGGAFNHSAFFWVLCQFFDNRDFEEFTTELLEWWNK
ncbi:hypothetical protein M422DRAFT_157292 [Sphaerobolus stellatus SS14]|nr:hypothetical protein M422DRAFT_157292 [Sphaerobolus stellatus SS14]